MADIHYWHDHFAWLPVTCIDGREAWLMTVQRRVNPAFYSSNSRLPYWQYRLPEPDMSWAIAGAKGIA